MIPKDTVDKILDAAEIVDVINDYVPLKKHGSSYVACCPFHNEKTPSFHVTPSKGVYYCFGCHKGGSAVGFVMEYEHMSYYEALRHLARKYHIEVVEREETAEDIEQRQHNESLMLLSDWAGKFFVNELSSEEGRSIGYEYFKSRGLEDETIRKYGLGWAPKSRRALTDAALKAGYKEEYLEETGLCQKGQDGSLRDNFYDRVVFPIDSVDGRVIGFGARTLSSDRTVAKYKNSKESSIYVKRLCLYGISYAKKEISQQDRCYLAEGYLDVLSMHQLGITNVVASSGTALTVEQIRLIRRFTRNVTIMYDGDNAGRKAALRGVSLFLKEGLNVRVLLFPEGDDPDSFAQSHTLAQVREYIADNERDFIDFQAEMLISDAAGDPLRKADAITAIADSIANIPDEIKRQTYAQAVSDRFAIESGAILRRIRSSREEILRQDRLEKERAGRRRAGGSPDEVPSRVPPPEEEYPYDGPEYPYEGPVPETARSQEVRGNAAAGPLAAAERELCDFIIGYGATPLKFETDSEYYSDEEVTVFDFIDAALEGEPFTTPSFRALYDAYAEKYEAGFSQDVIVKSLFDGEDRSVAALVNELVNPRYELSVARYRSSLMSTDSWLVKYVPRTILVYNIARVDESINALKASLKQAAPEEQTGIIKEIMRKQDLCKVLKVRLGREKE